MSVPCNASRLCYHAGLGTHNIADSGKGLSGWRKAAYQRHFLLLIRPFIADDGPEHLHQGLAGPVASACQVQPDMDNDQIPAVGYQCAPGVWRLFSVTLIETDKVHLHGGACSVACCPEAKCALSRVWHGSRDSSHLNGIIYLESRVWRLGGSHGADICTDWLGLALSRQSDNTTPSTCGLEKRPQNRAEINTVQAKGLNHQVAAKQGAKTRPACCGIQKRACHKHQYPNETSRKTRQHDFVRVYCAVDLPCPRARAVSSPAGSRGYGHGRAQLARGKGSKARWHKPREAPPFPLVQRVQRHRDGSIEPCSDAWSV